MNVFTIKDLEGKFKPPVLIVSTAVGRGMYSIGEAVAEAFCDRSQVHHVVIEDYLPSGALDQDFKRYRVIADKFTFLLYLIYKIPIFYYRKYIREKYFKRSDLSELEKKIRSVKANTVICISHRPAFWVSNLKYRKKMDFKVWGVLGELGRTLGWKYIFWDGIDGFLSPVDKDMLDYKFGPQTEFIKFELPAREEFYGISGIRGGRDDVLLVCGYWGQGRLDEVVRSLSKEMPGLKIHVVCGDNAALYERASALAKDNASVAIYGSIKSMGPLLAVCASIITKPGISSILEARAANRKIFLLKGMPVAEDNNARYAIEHFGAQWFDVKGFKRWHDQAS